MVNPATNLHDLVAAALPAWAIAALQVFAAIASIMYWIYAALSLGRRLALTEEDEDASAISGKAMFILLLASAVGLTAFLVVLHQLSCGSVVAC